MAILPSSMAASSTEINKNFVTHLNYIKCIDRLTRGLQININVRAQGKLENTVIQKFEKLSSITKNGIKLEKRSCDQEIAYSQIVGPWFPVKCYYRLYYLESTFCYLLDGARCGFEQGGHTKTRKNLRKLLTCENITFPTNYSEISTFTSWKDAHAFKTTSGATLRPNYYEDNNCPRSLRKKLAEYIELDWQNKSKIRDYRSKTSRKAKEEKLEPTEFGLLDFFYWMRIKANYRDVDFLDYDQHVSERDAHQYITYYMRAYENYACALEKCIQTLKSSRGMS